MWTMRWRAPAPAVDNAGALPTAGAFAHMTTASHHQEIQKPNTPRLRRGSGSGGSDLLRRQAGKVGQVYFGVDTLQACLPGLRARGGSVVNVGTNLFQNPVVPYHDYTASKAALLALTRTAAHEWGRYGIRVNMVSGGLLRTTDASRATPDFVFDLIAGQTPLRRVTTLEDFADAVVFFMSGLSRAVTGQNLVVDGGLVMN